MGHIQVPTEDHRLCLFQFFQICKEVILPLHTIGKPCQLILGVGRIYRYKIIIFKFQGDHAAFLVMLFDSNSVRYGYGFLLCEYGGS